jgi:exopolysaccharide biosynthesis polyprenyl glycosylphosphotransferase
MAVMEPLARTRHSSPSLTSGDAVVIEGVVPRIPDVIPLTEVPHATAKRVLDVIVTTVILVLAAPFMLAMALLIKLTSRGPVLFAQTRVGLGGKHFTCYKFRSMFVDAEDRRDDILHLNELSGPVFKIRNDPRVTAIGRILRKLSLDELPQLFNVLRGEMSLVGPRPPLPREVEEYGPRELMRLSVQPGLTCIWQVSGRSNLSFERWVELDLIYIQHMSLRLDMELLVRTVPAVLTCRGAH